MDDVPDVIRERNLNQDKFDFINVPNSLNVNFEGVDLSRDDRYAVQIDNFLKGLANNLINPSIYAAYLEDRHEKGALGLSIGGSLVVREECYDVQNGLFGMVCEFKRNGKNYVLVVDAEGVKKFFAYSIEFSKESIKLHDFRECDCDNVRLQFVASYLQVVYQEVLSLRETSNRSRG